MLPVGKRGIAKLISKQVIIKWRGKPVFIRHRTETEIKEADDTKWEALRDPQPDSDRVQKPEWLIMLGALSPSSSTPTSQYPNTQFAYDTIYHTTSLAEGA